MIKRLKSQRHLATVLCLLGIALFPLADLLRGRSAAQAAPALIAALPRPERAPIRLSADLKTLADGRRAELTLDPRAQRAAERILDRYVLPYAAVAMISVEDGRVLALHGRSRREPERDGAELALTAWAPAASVFKLVTASALLSAGVTPLERTCYHDGIHSVEPSNLIPHPRWDSACQSLGFGLAKSNNAIVGRLANDRLSPSALDETARALGFGRALDFELPVEKSAAEIPKDSGLAFARVAAGFWQTTLSPLHGAYLAATLARGGETPPLHLVDRVTDADGNVEVLEPPASERVLPVEIAREVSRMMVGTTEFGTARSGFRDARNRPLLPFTVAGKTGTLNRKDPTQPFLGYSWFVGFAPAERPEVAFAVLLGNGDHASMRAHQVARELLSAHFLGDGSPSPSARIASR